MSTAAVTEGPERVSVHFPEDVLSAVNKVHGVLEPKGITRNQVITQATLAGLPSVLRKLKDKKPEVPFSKSVETALEDFKKKADITTELVCQKMREQGFQTEEEDLISRVSQCLTRLEQRKTLKFHKLSGRKRVYRKV